MHGANNHITTSTDRAEECLIQTEEEGFEPPVRFPVQRFSRPPVSTAHPFLRCRAYSDEPRNSRYWMVRSLLRSLGFELSRSGAATGSGCLIVMVPRSVLPRNVTNCCWSDSSLRLWPSLSVTVIATGCPFRYSPNSILAIRPTGIRP